MDNVFTVDVEDWFHTMDFNFHPDTWENYDDRIDYGINLILDFLDKHSIKATFYTLGCVARKQPELIKRISSKGHEIGSHGNFHRMITTQDRDEFRRDILSSKQILEEVTGKEINLYRSSSWSVVPETLWALEILDEEGFICDSSIQPFRTPLSGFKNAPRKPFYPIINGRKLKLLEFPSSVLPFYKACFPFCGGLYLRVFPVAFIKFALEVVNRETHGMIYTHPWELDAYQPRLKVPVHIRFTHYYNLKATANKLDKLLEISKFTTMGEILKKGGYEAISIN